MNTPPENHRPPGRPESKIDPSVMKINQEIWALMDKHYAIPTWPDGECVCRDLESASEHQADHLVEVLVKEFELDWKRGT